MEIFIEIALFLEMTTKFAVRQMTSIRRLLCEALVGNVDLGSKNASQENICMSSQMGHQLSINDLGQKDANKIQQTPVYSLSECWFIIA